MELENKRYLITGASSGIGLRLVRRLLALPGTRVTAVARHVGVLEDMDSDRLHVFSADVTRPESNDALLAFAMDSMGGIDAVLACAGFTYYETFAGRDWGHIERILRTNVIAPLYLLQRALEVTEGPLSYAVISSALGLFALPGYAMYSMTKFALDGFQDAFRFEEHPRLHYMTVYPIGVSTPFWKRIHGGGAPDNSGADMPLPRPLQTPETVADRMLSGLRRGRKRVFTSRAFRVVWVLNRVLPFIALYQRIHKRKFRDWAARHPGE